jgi:hypothetical protein
MQFYHIGMLSPPGFERETKTLREVPFCRKIAMDVTDMEGERQYDLCHGAGLDQRHRFDGP